MAMAKICAGSSLKSVHLLQRCRPAYAVSLLPRDKQLVSPSFHIPSTALRASTRRVISFFSQRRLLMDNGFKVSSLSDGAEKASFVTESAGGGGDNDHGDGRGGGSRGGGDGPSDSGKGDDTPPKSIFSWYLLLLNNHPVATKAITSAILTLIGDLVCQLMVEKAERVDMKRTGVFTLLGLVLVGPTLHFWYLTLSKLVPGPGTIRAGARLVLDQFLFSPIFIGIFFSALLTLEGHSHDIVPKLKQDWPSAVVANWKIWIPFQFLNFLLVPQQLQVLAANVISLAWNTYLSFATHKDVMSPAQKDSISS